MREGQLSCFTKYCLGCDKKFVTINKDQETCSTDCYLKWFQPKIFAQRLTASAPNEEEIDPELDLLIFDGSRDIDRIIADDKNRH